MPFNTLAVAQSYAPQLGTLADYPATTPTATQAAFIHARAYDYIRTRLKRAGVSATFTAATAGEGWAKDVEARLTSGRLLLAKGSVGVRAEGARSGGDTTATRLIASAMDDLQMLDDDRNLRLSLIADGSAANLPASGFATSDWSDGHDPDLDTAFGGDDLLYVPGVPVVQDGEGL